MIHRRKTLFLTLIAFMILSLMVAVGCSKKPAQPGPGDEVAQPAPEPQVKEFTPEPEPVAPAPEPEPEPAMISASDVIDVFFAFDKFDLAPESRDTLEKNANALKAFPMAKFVIEGHCDERGTNEYNLGLGERRASSAKKYLVSLGIDGSRIETISYGEERPFASGGNEAAWKQNRRAHFVIK